MDGREAVVGQNPVAGCPCSVNRRGFLGASIGCGAYLAMALAAAPVMARRAFAQEPKGEALMTTPFARVEKLADGVWAVVSVTNNGDYTTVSNGGIVAGRDGVLCIEGFNTPAGGRWINQLAKELTGRWPDYVVLTHLHGDHSNGLEGYLRQDGGPKIISTATTRELMAERAATVAGERDGMGLVNANIKTVLPDALMPAREERLTIDLGGRSVTLRQRMGHTPSDLTVHVDSPRVVFTGDLVFNGLFPFYGDAIPSRWIEALGDLLDDDRTTYVPGHGSIASREELKPYMELMRHTADAAKRAVENGVPASEAWERYEVPESLGEWGKFRPDVYRFAFEAWEKELRG
jgi:glyoxylase-like metal-dependent hydrolase (beta-lactamase superfamily II)